MNYSEISPQDHLILLATEKEETDIKLAAALETNQQYSNRTKRLQQQIKELDQKAKAAVQVMNSKNDSLRETSTILQAELDTFPELDFMNQQFDILNSFCENDPTIKGRNLDISYFIENGLLDPGQEKEELIPLIDNLTHIYYSKYGGVFNFRVESNFITNDYNKLMNLISMIEGTMRNTARNYLKQTKTLQTDIKELKDMIKKYSK